ncbi:hypothetical protein GGI24_005386, partial [Coemansia furcata]
MLDPSIPDNLGIPPGQPGIDPGQSFAVVARNGHIQMGGAGHEGDMPDWKGISKLCKLVKFSTFNTLSGGELSCNELPIQIISDILFNCYCAYDIPVNMMKAEWLDACAVIKTGDFCHAMQNPRSNISIIGVCSAEDLATLEATTVVVKGKPVQHQCIIAHKDSLVYINIAGMSSSTPMILTQDIDNALLFYGTILDIEFEQWAGTLMTRACALIDTNTAIIPGHIMVKGRKWTLSGKTINPVCSY